MPRILFLDIETKPAVVHAWRLFDQNIALNQIIENDGVICFGAKWAGSSQMMFHADWLDGHKGMVKAAHALFHEADAVVTYNGDRFDIPKLRGEFCIAGLPPPPPLTSIDVYKSVKRLGLISNKLAHIGPLLVGAGKVKHEGHELWVKVMNGDPKAQAKMERYCAQDVRLLERVYNRVKPYIDNHPHMGFTPAHACGSCGSTHLQSRGFRRTKANLIQRLQCMKCGSWLTGSKAKAA